MIMDVESIKAEIRKELTPQRYAHSVGVMDEAVCLAEQFGADTDKARLAGILHDCAKCMPIGDAVDMLKRNGVEVDDITLMCPAIIHAPAGACYAREKYGVYDHEVLDAISYHTTARIGMTLLDKIIYIADMTEPSRNFGGVEQLRALARTDIDGAYASALRQSIIFNLQKGNIVHPMTLYAWNDICKND